MIRSSLTALALLALAGGGRADDKLLSPPPRFVTVNEVNEKIGEVIFSELTMRYIPKEVEREVFEDGKKVTVKQTVFVPEYTTALVKFAVKDGQVFDGAGKKLDATDVWKRVAVGAPVVLSSNFRMVDDTYLKLLSKDALVFVPAQPKAPPPPPAPMPKGA
jgi:hypothetical protein